MNKKIIISIASVCISYGANSAELSHSFTSPSFSGVGYSSHVLTLKQLEDQRKDKIQAAADALTAKALSDAANTPQAQFVSNLQSRIYSQLAKQITDSLFSSTGGSATCGTTRTTLNDGSSVCGLVSVGGNDITWDVIGTNIAIRIQNILNPSQVLEMTVPAGSFGF